MLTDAWCPNCQEYEIHTLGLLWWKPGWGGAQADLLCPACREAQLWIAYIYSYSLPEPYQFFVIDPGERGEHSPANFTVLVAAISLGSARHLERIYSVYYVVPHDFTGARLSRHLLR